MAEVLDRSSEARDEAGTAPGDRHFRPDVQGLRAVAILLVVLFHADIPGLSGGYVGVDVFFVISGFVITGVLLRERATRNSTSLPRFYARRARRILPAATLVIIVTVTVAYHYLGPLTGHETAVDGQWAAVFLANFHFAASQTNYLASQQPPSALQNYWSLAVEEQFYIVYPTLFLVTAGVFRRIPLRRRLIAVLIVIVVASYSYSIAFTSVNAASAFFSPLTRAWELALGGLIAVLGPSLRRVPRLSASIGSWLGLAAIVVASVSLTSATVYPGALVAIPVVGAALVIAAGTARPDLGAERLLRQRPFQLLGLISYSLYLWHWPILVVATQYRGATNLPVWDNVVLLLIATVAAVLTYLFLENPVRHAKVLVGRPLLSIVLGLCLVGATLVVTTYEQHRSSLDLGTVATATPGSVCNSPTVTAVSQLKASYAQTHSVRSDIAHGQHESVAVIGDSTSCTLLPGLQAVGPSYGLHFDNGAVIGCGIVSGTLAPMYDNGQNIAAYTTGCQAQANRAESVAIERYDPRVILWGSTREQNSIVVSSPHGTKVLQVGTPEWRSVLFRRIDTRVEQFLSTGAAVILLLEPPQVHQGSRTQPDAEDIDYERMNTLLSDVAARHPDQVGVINLEARVCPSGPPCPYVVPGFNPTPARDAPTFHCGAVISPVPCAETLRPLDGLHYTPTGSLWVAEWLVPRIASVASALSSRK